MSPKPVELFQLKRRIANAARVYRAACATGNLDKAREVQGEIDEALDALSAALVAPKTPHS